MLVEQENILFKKWAKTRSAFSRDGIINEIDYLKSDIKVLLILKEVNSKTGKSVDLKEFLQHGAYNRRATWDNVTRWIYGIRNIDKSIHWKEIDKKFLTREKRKQILSSIIVMNLKKSPGKHTTINDELKVIIVFAILNIIQTSTFLNFGKCICIQIYETYIFFHISIKSLSVLCSSNNPQLIEYSSSLNV